MYVEKILKKLVEVDKLIKNSGISTWCDHIPEWQKFITNLLQYLCSIENNVYNPINSKYLENSLQYYVKIKNYFYLDALQEQLLILKELIECEIQYNKYLEYNNKYHQNNELFCNYLSHSYQGCRQIKFSSNVQNVNNNHKIDFILFKYKCDLKSMFFKQKINRFLHLDFLNQILSKLNLKNNI